MWNPPEQRRTGCLGPPTENASRCDCSIEHSDGGRMPVDCQDATHIHESRGFCRMGKCAGRNCAFRRLHLVGTGPSGRLSRSGSTRVDLVLETSCADNVAKYSGRAALSSFVGCSSSRDERGHTLFVRGVASPRTRPATRGTRQQLQTSLMSTYRLNTEAACFLGRGWDRPCPVALETPPVRRHSDGCCPRVDGLAVAKGAPGRSRAVFRGQ
jgi:hypothetical protein